MHTAFYKLFTAVFYPKMVCASFFSIAVHMAHAPRELQRWHKNELCSKRHLRSMALLPFDSIFACAHQRVFQQAGCLPCFIGTKINIGNLRYSCVTGKQTQGGMKNENANHNPVHLLCSVGNRRSGWCAGTTETGRPPAANRLNSDARYAEGPARTRPWRTGSDAGNGIASRS